MGGDTVHVCLIDDAVVKPILIYDSILTFETNVLYLKKQAPCQCKRQEVNTTGWQIVIVGAVTVMRLSDTAVAAGGKSILMASQLLTGERLDVSQSTSFLSHRPT